MWLLLVVYHALTAANYIDCSDPDQCDPDIVCLPNEDCFVSCTAPNACLDRNITCPVAGDCVISCIGGAACRGSVINATASSSGHFNLTCSDSTDHCKEIKVYGSTIESNTDQFQIHCNGNTRACARAEVTCPVTGRCDISCGDGNGQEGCRWMSVAGPLEGELSIHCDGPMSCFDAVFDGTESDILNITGCTEFEGCFGTFCALAMYFKDH